MPNKIDANYFDSSQKQDEQQRADDREFQRRSTFFGFKFHDDFSLGKRACCGSISDRSDVDTAFTNENTFLMRFLQAYRVSRVGMIFATSRKTRRMSAELLA